MIENRFVIHDAVTVNAAGGAVGIVHAILVADAGIAARVIEDRSAHDIAVAGPAFEDRAANGAYFTAPGEPDVPGKFHRDVDHVGHAGIGRERDGNERLGQG